MKANITKLQTMSGDVGSFCSARVLRRHGLGCRASGREESFEDSIVSRLKRGKP